MKNYPSHQDELSRLKKVEGQIRAAQKMIEEGRYCVEILHVLLSAEWAIKKTEDEILKRHLKGCVTQALSSGSAKEKEEKTAEMLELIAKFRK